MNDVEPGPVSLLQQAADAVPVGPVPLTRLLREGQRSRRRRTRLRSAGVGVAAALAISGVLVTTTLTGQGPSPQGDAADRVEQALASYDPDAMPQLLLSRTRDTFSTAYPDLPAGRFAAEDPFNDVLPTEDYDKATYMTVNYQPTSVQALSMWLGHQNDPPDRDPNRTELTQTCTSLTRSKVYETCEVIERDGQLGLSSVRLVEWRRGQPGDFRKGRERETRITPSPPQTGNGYTPNPDRLWYEHDVSITHPGGYVTVVTESVKATDLDTAQDLFELSTDEMADLAGDPQLVIPRPPLGFGGCTYSINHQCTQVAD